MIATVNLSVPEVVNGETERTARSGFKCPSCTNIEQKLFVFDSSSGETICQKCGAILEIENINQNQEWSAFDIEEFNEKARTGTPSSLAPSSQLDLQLHEIMLGTIVQNRMF
jgi:transcription initiation factor TFIIIB Brf1 subunit/transcription initiation factor TFIIB